MKKKVLLLAVSCKNGGLCPGGIDMDSQSEWIRIVKNDGNAGSVQGYDIDFAKPLDIIEFDGRPMPQGKQQENWVIDNRSCRKIGSVGKDRLDRIYINYGYHGFWGNIRSFLNEEEFQAISQPSESILRVSDIRIYKYGNKAKIDFTWSGARFPIRGISMTDQDYYDIVNDGNEVHYDEAYIVVSIPKDLWYNPSIDKKQAYKFVSKVFKIK